MVLWELFVEVIEKYTKDFFHSRRSKHWKQNLFLIPFVLAILFTLLYPISTDFLVKKDFGGFFLHFL
jgi:hypothetical protein